MRTLVVGSYPPVPGPEARATLDSVRDAVRAGATVRVLSAEPGAAHESDNLSGIGAAWSLARRARHYDALILHVEPGLPLPSGAGRVARIAQCAAIGAALGRYRDVTVHLDDPLAVPGSVGGRTGHMLWRHVQHVSVRNEADAAFLCEQVGIERDRLVVRAPTGDRDPGGIEDALVGGAPHLVAVGELGEPRWRSGALDAAGAMSEIRNRAAVKRAAAGTTGTQQAALGSRHPVPQPPPGVASVVARGVLKRALGNRAPAVGAAARRLRARVTRAR